MKNFKSLKIWNKGMEIVKDIYSITKHLPEKERYGLNSQITRAAISVPSNIAEGASRSTAKHYKQFILMALGSCFELETLLLIIKDNQQIDPIKITPILDKVIEQQRMLSGFLRKLN